MDVLSFGQVDEAADSRIRERADQPRLSILELVCRLFMISDMRM